MAMVVTEFEFFEVEGEPVRGDAVMLDQALFRPTPKAFEAVDVDLAIGEPGLMVHRQMSISTKHQCIIRFVFVSIYQAATANFFRRDAEQCRGLDVRNRLNANTAITLKYPKNRDFPGRTASSLPFAFAAKVRFVEFDFASQEEVCIVGMSQDRMTDRHDRLVGRIVCQVHLLGDPACRKLKLKELHDSQPIVQRQTACIDPTARQVVKRVSTPRTTPFSISQFPQFATPATRANPLLVFEAKSQHVFSRRRFAFYQPFKGIYVHST